MVTFNTVVMGWVRAFVLVCLLSGPFLSGADYRIHVQPGNRNLVGDGQDYTTLTITARDSFGELVRVNTSIEVKVDAGWLEQSKLTMRDGVAETILKAPILDNESLVFKRSMEITMRMLQSVQGMDLKGSSPSEAKTKIMKKMLGAAKTGPNAASMTTVSGSKPTIHVIASAGSIQGKAEIHVVSGETEQAGAVRSGVYEGKDVTGQSSWKMTIQTQGKGFKGTLSSQGETMAIQSEGESKAGFLVIYIYDQRELKQFGKSEIAKDFKGWPTALKTLPGNTVYIVAPPLYLTWKRDVPKKDAPKEDEIDQLSTVSLVAKRNMLPGDGKTQTKMVFAYRDEKGRPVAGKKVEFSLMRGGMGGKLLKTSGVTDGNGIARTVYQAPEFKTDKLQKLGTCKKEIVYADYLEGKEKERVSADIGILCCTDAFLVIEKPGFTVNYRSPVLVESPYGEFSGQVKQKIVNKLSPARPEIIPIVNAECRLTGGALKEIENTLKAKTDEKGKFKINLPMKNWPVFRKMEPELAPFGFAKHHEHRRDEITGDLFKYPDMQFRHWFSARLYQLEKAMCLGEPEESEAQENKLQILGDLNEITWMTDKLIRDTASEALSQGWSFLGAAFTYANKRWKFTKALDDKLGQVNSKLNQYIQIDSVSGKGGVKRILFEKLKPIFDSKSILSRNTSIILGEYNSKIYAELNKLLGGLVGELAKLKKWPENPVPSIAQDIASFPYRTEVQNRMKIIMATDAMTLNDAYAWLQPWLVTNSGNLRAHYLNIAGWRMTAEEGKAWKDLAVDISLGIAIGSAFIGNASALQTWQKLKKYSERLDAGMALCGFFAEMWNISKLKAECLALFDKVVSQCPTPALTASMSRSPFNLNPAMQSQNRIGRNPDLKDVIGAGFMLPPAESSEPHPTDNSPKPPRLSSIVNLDDLKINDNQLPLKTFVQFLNAWTQWETWEMEHTEPFFLSLSSDNTQTESWGKALAEMRDCVEELKIQAAFSNGTFASQTDRDQWNEKVNKIETLVSQIDSLTADLFEMGLKVSRNMNQPDKGPPPGYAAKGKTWSLEKLKDRRIILVGLVGLGILICLVIIILLLGKSKKRTAGRPKPASASPPTAPAVVQGDRIVFQDGRTIQLSQNALSIGSHPSNPIQIHGPGVASFHARICFSAEHANWWIASITPNAPLQVNGQMGANFWLAPGSQIAIGQQIIFFYR